MHGFAKIKFLKMFPNVPFLKLKYFTGSGWEVGRCWATICVEFGSFFTAKAVAFRLLLWVNFSQAPKFTEISDLLEYLLKKYFIWGLPKTAISQKKKFSVVFTSQTMLIGPLQPLPGSKKIWIGRLALKMTRRRLRIGSGLAPKMDDVGSPDSFFD